MTPRGAEYRYDNLGVPQSALVRAVSKRGRDRVSDDGTRPTAERHGLKLVGQHRGIGGAVLGGAADLGAEPLKVLELRKCVDDERFPRLDLRISKLGKNADTRRNLAGG